MNFDDFFCSGHQHGHFVFCLLCLSGMGEPNNFVLIVEILFECEDVQCSIVIKILVAQVGQKVRKSG